MAVHDDGAWRDRTVEEPGGSVPVGSEHEDTGGSREPEDSGDGRPKLRRALAALGPGLITGAADNDPSGVATYAQAGAMFGNASLWAVPVTLPLMLAVQETADRTALATGQSLGALARRKFGRGARTVLAVLLVVLLVSNVLQLSADLMAVGSGMEMLHGGPAQLWSAVAGTGILVAMLTGSFEFVARLIKWLCLSLLAYFGVLVVTGVDWADVGSGLLGTQFEWNSDYLGIMVAVLGTTISPYLFFWQSSNRIEQLRSEVGGDERPSQVRLTARNPRAARRKWVDARVDVFTGMVFSQLVMFAVITATGATLGTHHLEIRTAADAANALAPIAGPAAAALFAVGFIGSGVLGVPVLAASASAGIASLTGRSWGLDRTPRQSPLFYLLVALGTLAAIGLSLVYRDPIGLLVFSSVVQGIAAGPFLVVLMLVSSDRKLMGEHRNRTLSTVFGWAATLLMSIAGIVGIWHTVTSGP
ncbi:Nramp family divalent metal transporter [Sinomonas susongensis]|uniref:Nramp family divalent metal transporter n=1 Tax=Sinomonas susongensis TaxID=1324851 RepID=UPI001485C60F|nr:Nramp family divalent metal transporter [Sinomonas susongensis]